MRMRKVGENEATRPGQYESSEICRAVCCSAHDRSKNLRGLVTGEWAVRKVLTLKAGLRSGHGISLNPKP